MMPEEQEKIYFFSEDCDFTLDHQLQHKKWIHSIIENNNASLENINYIFCSDDYLLEVNKKYLDHDFYTDIISFPYSEKPKPIQGDIFVSVDRVKENAKNLDLGFEEELRRVLAHGLLHFLGYKDKTEDESKEMREKEEEAIALFG